MRIAALTVTTIALAGCASGLTGGRESDYERLVRTCQERGGILVPSNRPSTGRVETDNVCRISGGASRIRD